MTRKQIETAANKVGWNCIIKRNDNGKTWHVNFNTDTRFGQDVEYDYEVKTLDCIANEVYETWQNYDPDEETMLWYKADKGEPKNLRDLIKDMDEIEEALEHLYIVLNGSTIPEKKTISYSQKAEELRTKCLSELLSNWHNAKPSKFGYDAKGFANPNRCSQYEEIIYLYGRWLLIDGNGNQYQIGCMPLEEFCQMVDKIITQK